MGNDLIHEINNLLQVIIGRQALAIRAKTLTDKDFQICKSQVAADRLAFLTRQASRENDPTIGQSDAA